MHALDSHSSALYIFMEQPCSRRTSSLLHGSFASIRVGSILSLDNCHSVGGNEVMHLQILGAKAAGSHIVNSLASPTLESQSEPTQDQALQAFSCYAAGS